MKSTTARLLFVAAGCSLAVGGSTRAELVSTAFTYQGQLKQGGVPANGHFDLMFRLFDQAEDGDEIPGPDGGILVEGMLVTAGLFTVDLDFGPDVFQSHDELWLEVSVKPAEFAPADFTVLIPRQRLSPAPRAIVADYAQSTAGGTLRFGEMSETSIGVSPNLSGLTAMDPFGMRITSTTVARRCSGSGEPCWFDQDCPDGETCEPCDTCESVPTGAGAVYFGLQDKLSISKKQGVPGLAVNGGMYLLGGTRICSNRYSEYGYEDQVHVCEADLDCYGCCTPMKHCEASDEQCDSDEGCPVGTCNESGNPCHSIIDCNPGECHNAGTPCYHNAGCPPGDTCTSPPPEGCWGGERCGDDYGCTMHCYTDADCPDVGASCDSPSPSECITPEGRCSGNQLPCHYTAHCPLGYCQERPERHCHVDGHCLTGYSGEIDHGPCVGGEVCVHPEPIGPVAVHFGETGMHSIGYNPILGGLTATDPEGLHLVSTASTCSGTGEFCESHEDCPAGHCAIYGWSCRDDDTCGLGSACNSPPPETCESVYGGGSVKVLFGLGNDSSIGTDWASTGLVVKDPVGLRLMSPGADMTAPTKLLLGPTDDHFIGYNDIYTGTHINDPDGIHLTSMMGAVAQTAGESPTDVRLYFGPTNDTYIGTLPEASGLALADPGGVRILNSSDPAEISLIFGMNSTAGVGGTRIDTGIMSDGMRFMASDFFFDGGPVGIGDSSPEAHLDVEKSFPVGTPGAVAVFNRTGSDGVVLDFQRDGSSVGDISTSRGIVSYNSFTGSHLAWTDMTIERGSLVRLTGVNRRLHGDSESEIVYGIAPSTTANDPSCVGTYLTTHDIGGQIGAGQTHLVMAEGNGEMWVVSTGEDIRPGDYLISSDVSGCAMRDDSLRFSVGHIVARAAEGVRWDSIEPGASAVKKAKVSVFFEHFVRSRDTTHLTGELDRLSSIVESQRRTIEALEEKLDSLENPTKRMSCPETPEAPERGETDSRTGGVK